MKYHPAIKNKAHSSAWISSRNPALLICIKDATNISECVEVVMGGDDTDVFCGGALQEALQEQANIYTYFNYSSGYTQLNFAQI